MPAKIIEGKPIAEQIKNEVRGEINEIIANGRNAPSLAVIIVGENPASQIYVRDKKKACAYVGIRSVVHELPESTTESELLELIGSLNSDSSINGILVQLPLPSHVPDPINTDKVLLAVSPEKDVDCFHPYNAGCLAIGNATLLPCTPAGVIEMIKRGVGGDNIIEGKHCVVIGRSNIVGKPMAQLLLQENGTVTICHSRTKNLAEICRTADILVAAVGKPRFVTGDMIKEGAVVIDVGIHKLDKNSKKVCGDVDFDSCKDIAAAISPVPGGVGVMTIAMLMRNCLDAYKAQAERGAL